jgi:hypothetical protein
LTPRRSGEGFGMSDSLLAIPHPEEPRSGVSKDAGPTAASWFETAQRRLLTMRIWRGINSTH